jgi:hypothetical protein
MPTLEELLPDIEPERKDPALWREYAEILHRFDAPQEGDADRLVDLCHKLELIKEDVAVHLAVFEEHAALLAEKERLPERKAAYERNEDARQKNWAAYVKAQQKYAETEEKMEIKSRELLHAYNDCASIDMDIRGLENAFHELFGIPANEVTGQVGTGNPKICNLQGEAIRRREVLEKDRPKLPKRTVRRVKQ